MFELLNLVCDQTNARDQNTPPVVESAPAKKTSPGIGTMTENLLMKEVNGRGLTYQTILSIIQDEHPGRSSIHCVRWYASKMNKRGIALPSR